MSEALKVLLVDDDEDDLFLTQEALADAPGEYEVETATSVARALRRAESVQDNVYIVDYRLGAESGLDFIRRASDLGREGPFILLTGQGEAGTDTEAIRAGASDYLAKAELTPQSLDRSIRYAVERQSLLVRVRDARKLETVGVLAAGIAHEYNNLLTAILGSIDLARSSVGRDTNATSRHLSTIETAAKEAAGMTHRLLAFAGSARVDSRPLLLQDLIEASIAVAYELVGETFHVEISGAWQAPFDGDGSLVANAIGGVLANAHEAAPLIVPTLVTQIRDLDLDNLKTFREARRVKPGTFVVLTITNHGDVLSPLVIEQSFEPFYSTNLGRELGLAAAHATVRSHGGAMRLEARDGGGAITTIALPTRRDPQPQAAGSR